MALTDNGHGDVCRYYSYDMHQMVPDLLIGNYGFLESLTEEERAVFEEGFEELERVQQEEWGKAVEAAREKAEKGAEGDLSLSGPGTVRSGGTAAP